MRSYSQIILFLCSILLWASCESNQDRTKELEQIVQSEKQLLDSIVVKVQAYNPDFGLTIYSHYRKGRVLTNQWDSLYQAIPSADLNESVLKLKLAEWNLGFNQLEQASIYWWNNAYLPNEKLMQFNPILLQLDSRNELKSDNINVKRSECLLINIEMLLLNQIELVDYFKMPSPGYDTLYQKCLSYGMTSKPSV